MNYNKRLTLVIIVFTALVLNIVIYYILDDRTTFSPVLFENIGSRFPSQLKVADHEKNGWRGITAQNNSKSQWVYMLKKPHDPGRNMADYLPPRNHFKRLRIDDQTYFGIYARGKNYRFYVYVFVLQDTEYWIESGCSYTTLLHVKKMADTILDSLTVNGSRAFQNTKKITDKTTNFVSPRYSQSVGFLLAIINGAMVFSILLPFILFYFSGLPPAQKPGGLIREFPHVSIRTRVSNWKNQSIDGFVASSRNEILIYQFKKLQIIIPFSELVDPTQVKIGKTPFLKQDYISFSFANTASVLSKRKSPVRKIRIYLYLKPDRIRELLLNTDFPFKDKIYYKYDK